ncbi:MAG: GntR family transcriptional regulator [Steroidobacteraceae bacterium]|nr:GntR family transcriptional regulator [Steroidobacteraceae bacterium]
MEDYWATRTGRWRKAMQGRTGPSFADRLFEVIVADIRSGALPAGALLPSAERVAGELTIATDDVRGAYARLLAEDVIVERNDGVLCIPALNGEDASVGDATQIRFEAALLKAVREAAARGLSPADATGMFKAAILRMEPKSKGPGVAEESE